MVKINCQKCGLPLGPRDVQFSRHAICPRRIRRQKEPVRIPRKGVDELATEARKFKHPKSRVMLDGREILYVADYKARVREVLERDGYKCIWQVFGGEDGTVDCGAAANNHPHHVVRRSKSRDDRAENLISICDMHHKIAHPEHRTRFGEKPGLPTVDESRPGKF